MKFNVKGQRLYLSAYIGDCFDNAAIESFATLRAHSTAGPASISRNQRLMFGHVLLAKPLFFCNH
jgi:hypothetical protein